MVETDATLERAIGAAWTDDRAWTLLTHLTELPDRMGGSPGEERAADLVSEAFIDAGLEDVRTTSFPMQYWERGTTEFSVVADPDGPHTTDRSFEAIALPYSPAGAVEGPLVDVGYGTPDEIEAARAQLEGAIAVASTTTPADRRFVHRMEKFGHAVDAGAAAFVFANHVPGQLPPTGALRFDGEAPVPGVGVSAETHDWLQTYADRGAKARLHVEATTQQGSSQNVHGTIGTKTGAIGTETEMTGEGTEPTVDGETGEVLVVAHYDAHDIAEGALDNGCGIATVLAATRILTAIDDDLGCPVRVAAVGCEEIGLLGAEALADRLDHESIRAVVNVDGAGRFRNLRALTHGSPAMGRLADRVAAAAGQPITTEPEPHPFSDHWPFLRAGVPALQLHSEPPDGAERGRGWGHTAADTRDKVDRRNLREHAILTALLVREVTHAELDRISGSELCDRLREQEYEPGMRAASIWPKEWDDR